MPRSTKVRRSSALQKRQGFRAVCCEDSEVSVMVAMEFSMILGKQITLESQGWDGFPRRQTTLTGQKVGNELKGKRRVPSNWIGFRHESPKPGPFSTLLRAIRVPNSRDFSWQEYGVLL